MDSLISISYQTEYLWTVNDVIISKIKTSVHCAASDLGSASRIFVVTKHTKLPTFFCNYVCPIALACCALYHAHPACTLKQCAGPGYAGLTHGLVSMHRAAWWLLHIERKWWITVHIRGKYSIGKCGACTTLLFGRSNMSKRGSNCFSTSDIQK